VDVNAGRVGRITTAVFDDGVGSAEAAARAELTPWTLLKIEQKEMD
jgi:hypothetical protein